MRDVAQADRRQPPDWNPTRDEIERIKTALVNEAYPPGGRTGVGTVVRAPR